MQHPLNNASCPEVVDNSTLGCEEKTSSCGEGFKMGSSILTLDLASHLTVGDRGQPTHLMEEAVDCPGVVVAPTLAPEVTWRARTTATQTEWPWSGESLPHLWDRKGSKGEAGRRLKGGRDSADPVVFSGVFRRSKKILNVKPVPVRSKVVLGPPLQGPEVPLPWRREALPGLLPFTVPRALPEWAGGESESEDSGLGDSLWAEGDLHGEGHTLLPQLPQGEAPPGLLGLPLPLHQQIQDGDLEGDLDGALDGDLEGALDGDLD